MKDNFFCPICFGQDVHLHADGFVYCGDCSWIAPETEAIRNMASQLGENVITVNTVTDNSPTETFTTPRGKEFASFAEAAEFYLRGDA